MSTTDDDAFDDIRSLAAELGLEARPYDHDEVAAEEMLEHVLGTPRTTTIRPRRWRGAVASVASVAVAASVVALFALPGMDSPSPGGDAAGGAAASAESATPTPAKAQDFGYSADQDPRLEATLDSEKSALRDSGNLLRSSCPGCKELTNLDRLSASTRSIVIVDAVTVGARTRATVVESLRGDIAVGTRIEVVDVPLSLASGLSGPGRRLYLLAGDGPGPYLSYGTYDETSPGLFTTTRVVDTGQLRSISLEELRAALD